MTRQQQRRVMSSILLALTFTVLAMMVVGGTSDERTAATAAFYLVVPGYALVSAVGMGDAGLELAVGTGLSIALTIIASEIMLWTGAWHPYAAFAVLATVSIPFLAWRVVVPETGSLHRGKRAKLRWQR